MTFRYPFFWLTLYYLYLIFADIPEQYTEFPQGIDYKIPWFCTDFPEKQS